MMIRLWLRLRRKNQLRLGQSLLLILARMRASGVGLDGEPIEHLNTVVGSIASKTRGILVPLGHVCRIPRKRKIVRCKRAVMRSAGATADRCLFSRMRTLLLRMSKHLEPSGLVSHLLLAFLELRELSPSHLLGLNIAHVCRLGMAKVLALLMPFGLNMECKCLVTNKRPLSSRCTSLKLLRRALKRGGSIVGRDLTEIGLACKPTQITAESTISRQELLDRVADHCTFLLQRRRRDRTSLRGMHKCLSTQNRRRVLARQTQIVRRKRIVARNTNRNTSKLHIIRSVTILGRGLEVKTMSPKCRRCCALAVLECVPVMQ
eukprot:comp22483_c0_seq6/m.55754 comp22483_c0_seq6/g.55754  ORF comp22483_c0_seq6/g.55754 comp22483_c0_seq6/m.55754 type:complete len:319 (+) comp22483_c0_seq6:79-1035(+)